MNSRDSSDSREKFEDWFNKKFVNLNTDKTIVSEFLKAKALIRMGWLARDEEIESLAEAKKDAERYRYMRNSTSVMTFENHTLVPSHKLDMRIDEAIDKAKEITNE